MSIECIFQANCGDTVTLETEWQRPLDDNASLSYNQAMEYQDYTDEEIVDISDFFKLFGDPTRLRILMLLDCKGELGVTRISEELQMSQSAISQQLKVLRASRLVRFRKEGRNIIYRLADDHIHSILELGFEHYEELTV